MRRGWWKDLLAGAATLMDVAGAGVSRVRRTAVPVTRVTWAVTDEDLGPGWVSPHDYGPVPPLVTWTYHQWRAQQEAEADWSCTEITRPVRVLVTARDVRRAKVNGLLVPGEASPLLAEWIRHASGTPRYRLY